MKLVKKIVGTILLASIAIKLFMAPLIFANYELRKDFIIKNYCINKNRPKLHCDGKCYLSKQLKTAEQQDEKQATTSFISKLLSFETEIKRTLFVNYFPKKAPQVEKTPNLTTPIAIFTGPQAGSLIKQATS